MCDYKWPVQNDWNAGNCSQIKAKRNSSGELVDATTLISISEGVGARKTLSSNTLIAASYYKNEEEDEEGTVSIADSRVTIDYESVIVSHSSFFERPSYLDGQDKFRPLHCNSWLLIAGNRRTGNMVWRAILNGSRKHFRVTGNYWTPDVFASKAKWRMRKINEKEQESEFFIVGYNFIRQKHRIWFVSKDECTKLKEGGGDAGSGQLVTKDEIWYTPGLNYGQARSLLLEAVKLAIDKCPSESCGPPRRVLVLSKNTRNGPRDVLE